MIGRSCLKVIADAEATLKEYAEVVYNLATAGVLGGPGLRIVVLE